MFSLFLIDIQLALVFRTPPHYRINYDQLMCLYKDFKILLFKILSAGTQHLVPNFQLETPAWFGLVFSCGSIEQLYKHRCVCVVCVCVCLRVCLCVCMSQILSQIFPSVNETSTVARLAPISGVQTVYMSTQSGVQRLE